MSASVLSVVYKQLVWLSQTIMSPADGWGEFGDFSGTAPAQPKAEAKVSNGQVCNLDRAPEHLADTWADWSPAGHLPLQLAVSLLPIVLHA